MPVDDTHADALTPEACKNARLLLGVTVRELAEEARLDKNTVTRFEAGKNVHERTERDLRRALEAMGATFEVDAPRDHDALLQRDGWTIRVFVKRGS